jgi:hypothetical protein
VGNSGGLSPPSRTGAQQHRLDPIAQLLGFLGGGTFEDIGLDFGCLCRPFEVLLDLGVGEEFADPFGERR